MHPRFHTLKVKDIRQETEDVVSIAVEIPQELKENYSYLPGQYLTFKTAINGEEVRRSYSICTALHEKEWRVAVKKMPYGIFSTFANEVLQINDEVEVMTPMGEFTTKFDKNTEKSYVFFAAGSGVTPVMSLIKTILYTAPKSNVTLIYGNRGFDSVIFREELEDIKNNYMDNFSLLHVFSEEKIGNQLQDGLLDKEQVQRLYDLKLKDEAIDEVFVCGPEPCIFAVRDVFTEARFDKHNVHFELFTSPDQDNQKVDKKASTVPKSKKIDANVKVIIDDEEILLRLDSDGDSVLEAAIKAGADAPFSCKGGVCCTCKAKVLKGEVKMDKNYALEDDEVEDGYILTCQSHPISEELIVTYDE